MITIFFVAFGVNLILTSIIEKICEVYVNLGIFTTQISGWDILGGLFYIEIAVYLIAEIVFGIQNYRKDLKEIKKLKELAKKD